MKLTSFIILALIPFVSAFADITLVRDGQPRAVLVLAGGMKPSARAATTLLSHVRQMSGAELPVMTEKELSDATIEGGRIVPPPGTVAMETFILLGESSLTKKLGVSLDGIGVGGIVMKAGGNALVLTGRNEPNGRERNDANASAVAQFLETLGCRHLWPGPGGAVIPQRASISIATDFEVRFTPKLPQRKIRMIPRDAGEPEAYLRGLAWLGFTAADDTAAMTKALAGDTHEAWGAWNGLGGTIGLAGGHSGGGLHNGRVVHGKTHPEWFAMQADGTRDQSRTGNRWRVCESNVELRAQVASDILKQLKGKAQPPISLSPNDGGYSSFCMCANCKTLDPADAPKIKFMVFEKAGQSKRTEIDYPSLTDRHLHYWNDIAARVTKVVPGQLFIVDAYSVYSDAPVREKVHPSLIVRYVPSEIADWTAWQAAGARRIFWRPNNLNSGRRDGVLSPSARSTAENIRAFIEHGMLATDMEGIYDFWSTQSLEYYAAARATWNPDLDFDAMLDDYCRTGFGAGADQVKKYWLLAESGIELRKEGRRSAFPLIRPETLDAMRAALIAAAKATENDAPAHHRVAFLRTGLEFTAVSAEAHRLKEAAESGTKPDPAAVAALMERRWQMMRAIFQTQPLAVNVPFVALHDAVLNSALGWKGPSALAKEGKLQLPTNDNWLREDQSATRK